MNNPNYPTTSTKPSIVLFPLEEKREHEKSMGKRGTILSCLASLGVFALGATVGAHASRRQRRRTPPPSPPSEPTTPPTCEALPPSQVPLDCPVCLGDLILPRVTTCGHTLCTRCLAALFEHERRPACPVCRKRIRMSIDKLPVNFMIKSCVDARVAGRGDDEWHKYRQAEEDARLVVTPFVNEHARNGSVVATLRPAWNWFKWTVIIVTEFGAFLVSLKEVLESAPARTRRYQRIV